MDDRTILMNVSAWLDKWLPSIVFALVLAGTVVAMNDIPKPQEHSAECGGECEEEMFVCKFIQNSQLIA